MMSETQKWAVFLWSLSGFISDRAPFICVATDKEKGSIFVSNENIFRRSYRLEDFFWTGSGDGPVPEDSLNNETDVEPQQIYGDHFDTWRTTTVFHTTTILFATVFPNSCSAAGCQPKTSPVWTGSIEFSSPVHPSSIEIKPTPTRKHPDITMGFGNMTVLTGITKLSTVTEGVTPAIPSKTFGNSTSRFDGSGGGGGAAYPRFDIESSSTKPADSDVPLDQRYWLLTVLKRNDYSDDFKVHVIEEKLSVLYRKAFIRQQEKHLGINGNSLTTTRPRRDGRILEPVRVHIHNVSDSKQDINLLYSVTVAGRPVPALTAANDMRLMTLNEVVAELGYPVLTKAEPYIKGAVPIEARVRGRTRATWLLIGAVISAVVLLIILAIVFTFGLSRKEKDRNRARSASNKKHIFEAEEGSSNLAFQEDPAIKVKNSSSKVRGYSTKGDPSKTTEVGGTATVTFADQRRGSTSSSSCSGSSEASLVRLRHQQKKKELRKEISDEKPRPRPRTRVRRVESSEEILEDERIGGAASSSAVSRDRESFGGMTTEGLDDVEMTPRLTRTPTSYLSMPSVKAFPRGARIPEPLNRVLEPISIRYLDGDSDFPRRSHRSKVPGEDYETDCLHEEKKSEKVMTRHASLEGDPGVIGPVVWKRHYLKADNFTTDVIDLSEIDGGVNVSKMRKRFNELIDDAFSMFGSKNDVNEEKDKLGGDPVPMRLTDSRVHSAVIRPAELYFNATSSNRPKTTDSKQALTAMNQGPRGAWDSPGCTSATRTLQPPIIDKPTILVDSHLSPSDPAIPLIKAIKDELHKFDHASEKHTDPTY